MKTPKEWNFKVKHLPLLLFLCFFHFNLISGQSLEKIKTIYLKEDTSDQLFRNRIISENSYIFELNAKEYEIECLSGCESPWKFQFGKVIHLTKSITMRKGGPYRRLVSDSTVHYCFVPPNLIIIDSKGGVSKKIEFPFKNYYSFFHGVFGDDFASGKVEYDFVNRVVFFFGFPFESIRELNEAVLLSPSLKFPLIDKILLDEYGNPLKNENSVINWPFEEIRADLILPGWFDIAFNPIQKHIYLTFPASPQLYILNYAGVIVDSIQMDCHRFTRLLAGEDFLDKSGLLYVYNDVYENIFLDPKQNLIFRVASLGHSKLDDAPKKYFLFDELFFSKRRILQIFNLSSNKYSEIDLPANYEILDINNMQIFAKPMLKNRVDVFKIVL